MHIPQSTYVYEMRRFFVQQPFRGDISSRFGERLRHLRAQQRLSQFQLATNSGIDHTHIGELELGNAVPDLVIMELIALGLNMTLSELVGGL